MTDKRAKITLEFTTALWEGQTAKDMLDNILGGATDVSELLNCAPDLAIKVEEY